MANTYISANTNPPYTGGANVTVSFNLHALEHALIDIDPVNIGANNVLVSNSTLVLLQAVTRVNNDDLTIFGNSEITFAIGNNVVDWNVYEKTIPLDFNESALSNTAAMESQTRTEGIQATFANVVIDFTENGDFFFYKSSSLGQSEQLLLEI